jgi:DNA-binding MarR family transcriptional regulator
VKAEGNDIVANADRGYVLGNQIRARTGGADPSEQPDLRFSAMQKSILRELRKDGNIARGLLGKRLNLQLAKLDEAVVSLERDGFVARDGNGKARRLKLVNDPLSPACATDGDAPRPGKT